MKPSVSIIANLLATQPCAALPGPSFVRRAMDLSDGDFSNGQPSDGQGRGAPILGGTNRFVDQQNPDNLGRQPTDHGTVPNLKWRFSDSKTEVRPGGWLRSATKDDLAQSQDVSSTQVHLSKGAIRESHWHSVAEWGIVLAGSILMSAVDEHGFRHLEELDYGDIWYFPKGTAHTLQGLDDENELLLVFDQPNFEDVGLTFDLDDWIAHTPKSTLAKNFGVNATVFDSVPGPHPTILNGTVSNTTELSGRGGLTEEEGESFVFRTFEHEAELVPGGGGTFRKIDSTVFPVSKTIAATFMTLEPGALRELHWHPNAAEWLFIHSGEARATAFIGNENHRTFDFHSGDTAVFPDNSGHYIENTGSDNLTWIEIHRSDRVADISLQQWLALTPTDIVAQTLHVPIAFVESLKTEKQVSVANNES